MEVLQKELKEGEFSPSKILEGIKTKIKTNLEYDRISLGERIHLG